MEEKNGDKHTAVDPSRKQRTTTLIIVGAVVAVLLTGYLSLCAYAGSSGGRMAPGTVIGGVKVGGMSIGQASSALDAALQQSLSGMSVDFTCQGNLYSVPGTEFSYDTAELVKSASPTAAPFLARGFKFLGGMLNRRGAPVSLTLDHTPEEVQRAARECGDRDAQTTWEIRDTAIVFTKGRTGRTVDVAGLLGGLVERAGQLLNDDEPALYEPVEAVITVAPPLEPDFEAIRREIYAQVSEAYLDRETLEIVPSVTGKDLDVEVARTALERAEDGQTFRVEMLITEPETSTEALNEMLFRDVLGEATSRVTGTADRKLNVRVSAEYINGSILFPGEEFSFNQKCSPYTEDNGYGKATAYINGLSKDTVAGGICQASSTLYWASLKANLETVERYAHRYEPSYVNGGLDATVYGDYGESGSLDFRFRNDTDYPIKIEAAMDSKNYILVTIRGTNATGIHGEPYSTNREIIQAYETIYEADASVPQGTTQKDPERTGYNAVNWDTYQKLVDADGNMISETKLYTTKYKVRNETMLYNPADAELWGIDPATGLRSDPVVNPDPPGEITAPPETTVPEETGDPILPPEGSPDPLLPPVDGTMPPEETLTPPPAETLAPSDLPVIPPPGAIVVGQ